MGVLKLLVQASKCAPNMYLQVKDHSALTRPALRQQDASCVFERSPVQTPLGPKFTSLSLILVTLFFNSLSYWWFSVPSAGPRHHIFDVPSFFYQILFSFTLRCGFLCGKFTILPINIILIYILIRIKDKMLSSYSNRTKTSLQNKGVSVLPAVQSAFDCVFLKQTVQLRTHQCRHGREVKSVTTVPQPKIPHELHKSRRGVSYPYAH